MYHLVVTAPFLEFARGDQVTDPAQMEALLKDHHDKVVKVLVATPPSPPPAPKESK